ncbi:transmembrane protein 35B-like [Argopecten irradians]|uniref:transmembrane protein 35B-like n=1 Tax=Argopecten irradians TaxID=31199 RepID=UPI00371E9167
MARLAEYALTGFLSLVYIAMGFVKLYPTSQQMAFAITRQFQGYAKVCPTVLFEFVPDPHKYRVFVGVWEVCCGLALFTGDRELKQGASGILLVIMSLMLISNALLKNYSTMFFFAMHFFFLSYLFARCCRKPVQLITEEEEEKDFKKEQ